MDRAPITSVDLLVYIVMTDDDPLPFGIAINSGKDYVHISEPSLQRIYLYSQTEENSSIAFRLVTKMKGSDDKESCAPELCALAVDKTRKLVGKLY